MNVLVLTNMVPFVRGGAEELTFNLVRNLKLKGINAEAVRIPFSWEPYERLVDEMLLCKSLKIPKVDKVIAMKFPAYLAPCENKTFWLVHQYRQAYDLWDAGHSNIPDTEHGRSLREMIVHADNEAFAQADKLYAIQHPIADRLKQYNNFEAEVIIAPLSETELFTWQGDDGYIAATGRINHLKRQWMLLDALPLLPDSARLVIAGPPDTPADAEELHLRVRKYGLDDRVRLELRFLDRKELANIVGRSRAVACLPFEEDSMGYVAMEAYEASKPVITLTDSGGVLQVVRHGETGYVSTPDPQSLASSMAAMFEDPARARELGRAGYHLWRSFDINWASTMDRLLS